MATGVQPQVDHHFAFAQAAARFNPEGLPELSGTIDPVLVIAPMLRLDLGPKKPIGLRANTLEHTRHWGHLVF